MLLQGSPSRAICLRRRCTSNRSVPVYWAVNQLLLREPYFFIWDIGFGIWDFLRSAVRTPQSAISLSLSLPLFVLRIVANHPHHAFSMNDLALIADLFY